MISKSEPLRKVSETVYQEASPSADRSKPLEWRKSFNFVSLPLKCIKVTSNFNVHAHDCSLDDAHSSAPWKLIKPEIGTRIGIAAYVDEEKARDKLYCVTEANQEGGVMTLTQPPGGVRVTLRGGKPMEGNESVRAGIHRGLCFRANYEPGEDYLCLELEMPETQILEIVNGLHRDQNSEVEVEISLLSFSYEVDDALREWYHPRDLFIDETAAAAVMSVNVSSEIGSRAEASPDESDSDDSSANQTGNQALPIAVTHSASDFSIVGKALGSLTIAI
jgi:hypothetical protein